MGMPREIEQAESQGITHSRISLRKLSNALGNTNSLSAAYLAVLMAYALYYMWPLLFRTWFYNSDEYVYVAEVIRFLHFDFHQHFFDQPGTPFMSLAAIGWALFYMAWRSLPLVASPGGLERFTFVHLPALFIFMRGLMLLFYFCSLALTFLVGSRLTNRVGACVATLILMMSPVYTGTSSMIRTESLSMSFMLAAILMMLLSLESIENGSPKRLLIFVAGVMAGLAAGARLHSIVASLPVLLLLIWTTPRPSTANMASAQRFCKSTLLLMLTGGITILVVLQSRYFAQATAGNSIGQLRPLMLKLVRVMLAATIVGCITYYVPKLRHFVIRVTDWNSFVLLAGCAGGFFIGTPTVFTQYRYLVASAASYNASYKDYAHVGMPLIPHIMWFVNFYMQSIAPDKVILALLILGSLAVIFSGDRKLLVILVGAAIFFVSKPLDLAAAPHHVVLWLPFYAILCAYLIAKLFAVVNRKWPRSELWCGIALCVLLLYLFGALTSGPRGVALDVQIKERRMQSVGQATEWMRVNAEPNSMIATAYYCFNPGIFYTWLQSLEVGVPSYVLDGRQHVIWWGDASTLTGRQGYACVTQSDRYGMKTVMDMMHPGEGTDPYQDKRFRMIQAFGSGDSEVDLFAFNFRSTEPGDETRAQGDRPPLDLNK